MTNKQWLKFYQDRMIKAVKANNLKEALHNAEMTTKYTDKMVKSVIAIKPN